MLFPPLAEPYTVREARIHVRHVRDLLKSLDPSDAFNGVDCNSLSFLSVFTDGDLGGAGKIGTWTCAEGQRPEGLGAGGLLKLRQARDTLSNRNSWFLADHQALGSSDSGKRKKGLEMDPIDCTPPEYILPGSRERPLCPLQPQNRDWKVRL